MTNTTPTIRLDDRAGSRELYTPLLAMGLRVQLTRLPFGDIAFDGNGPDGVPYVIGIEHKTVPDVLKCIQDGRFAGHQLPGLLESYNYVYLMVEGSWRAGRDGVLQVLNPSGGRWYDQSYGNRTFTYNELHSWLSTMEVKAGVRVHQCVDQMASVHDVAGILRWWTHKDFHLHRAHLAFDMVSDASRVAILAKPSMVRRMAAELPGIGWERSRAVAAKFSTVVDMVAASEAEWCSIDGIGKVMARRIMKELGSDKLWQLMGTEIETR